MTTKKKFYELAEKHGVDVSYDRGYIDHFHGGINGRGGPVPFGITLDAPDGKLFVASSCHVDCSIQGDPGTTTTDWRAACVKLKSIIEDGFIDCDDPDCDQCADSRGQE